MGSDRNNIHLLNNVDGALKRCADCGDIRRFDVRRKIASGSLVLGRPDGLARDGFLFDECLLLPARSKDPREVWDAFRGARIGVLGQSKISQMDEGGEWKDEDEADRCPGRRNKLHFQGAGARPWLLQCRKGLARGSYNSAVADGCFPGKQIL